MGTLNVGNNARYQEADSIWSGGATNIGTTSLGAIGSGATVNFGDPNASSVFAQTVKDLSTASADSLKQLLSLQTQPAPVAARDDSPGIFHGLLGLIKAQPLLWLGGALLLAAGWWFMRSRR
jgi:hypothetical protein